MDKIIENIKKCVVGKAAKIVFNIDEMGSSGWENKKIKTLITHRNLCQKPLLIPVKRSASHQTLLACVGAAGDAILSIVNATRPQTKQIFKTGVREEIATNEIFYEYITKVFLLYISSQGGIDGFSNELEVLLMDNHL